MNFPAFFPAPGAVDPRRAFTLVEIMIVVVIIGLLAAMATAAITKVRANSEKSAVLNDLRVFAAAFEHYALENGQWPADTPTHKIVPTGMETLLKVDAWQRDVVGGGSWDWTFNNLGIKAAISLVNSGLTTEQLEDIDAVLDDGVLTTGSFRYIADARPALVLEEL